MFVATLLFGLVNATRQCAPCIVAAFTHQLQSDFG
jgi:hypothetical protein